MTYYTEDNFDSVPQKLDDLPNIHINLFQDLLAVFIIVIVVGSLIYLILKIKNKNLSFFKTKPRKIGLVIFLCSDFILLSVLMYAYLTMGFFAKYYYQGNQILEYLSWAFKYEKNLFAFTGFLGFLIGLFLIVLYDKTIGKIIGWVIKSS